MSTRPSALFARPLSSGALPPSKAPALATLCDASIALRSPAGMAAQIMGLDGRLATASRLNGVLGHAARQQHGRSAPRATMDLRAGASCSHGLPRSQFFRGFDVVVPRAPSAGRCPAPKRGKLVTLAGARESGWRGKAPGTLPAGAHAPLRLFLATVLRADLLFSACAAYQPFPFDERDYYRCVEGPCRKLPGNASEISQETITRRGDCLMAALAMKPGSRTLLQTRVAPSWRAGGRCGV